MTIKGKIVAGDNIKLGKNIGTWSTLMGNDVYTVNINGTEMKIPGTCGDHCKGCKKACYVKKSYRYPSVIKCHARNTLAIRDTEKCFKDLDGQLTRKRKKFEIVRIDQSGEVENKKQFIMWEMLATGHQETIFYIYTKNYEVATSELLGGHVPENMVVLFSIWHEYGWNEYCKVKHLANVKAFVYDDNEYHYNFTIQTYCKAYDDKGKLDHEITCEKCRKCFNKLATCKVIGCKAH